MEMMKKKTASWGHRLREENNGLREKIATLTQEKARLKKDLEKTWELMAHVPGGVLLLQRETIVYANKAACGWLGCSLGQLVGKTLSEVIDPEDIRSILKFIQAETGNQGPDALRFKNSEGKTVYCAVHLKKIRYGGRKAFLLNMIEIDRKMEQEKGISEAKKLEALQRMAKGFMREAEITAKTENALSAYLKDFSKQSYGPSEMSPLNLNEIIETSVVQCRLATGINLSQNDDPTDELFFKTCLNARSSIHGCKKDLENAFTSLVTNAVEALKGKGEIYLTTEEKPGMINIFVQENGVGIHEDMLDKIFDPFFTTKGSGHKGLGLSLARAVMDRHGGKIKVICHQAGGTTFHLELPLDHETFEINDRSKKMPIKDARILLIGGQNLLINLLCRFLAGKGLNITHIDSYGESLKALKGTAFDLLLADQRKNPKNTAWIIKKASGINPNLPIVVFNVSNSDYSKFSKKPGVDLALTRPLSIGHLFSGISRLLAEGKARKVRP